MEAELSLPVGRFPLERFVLVVHQESAVSLRFFMMGDEIPPLKETFLIGQTPANILF